MKSNVLKGLIVILALAAGSAFAAQLEPDLAARLAACNNPNQKFAVSFTMKDQTDAYALDPNIPNLPKPQRRARVAEVLREHAAATQRDLLAQLRTEAGAGNVDGLNSIWIVNEVACFATKDVIMRMVDRSDVSDIMYDLLPIEMGIPKIVPRPPVLGHEPNLDVTKAPGAWHQGYTGQGITVGEVDTGIWYTHQDLVNHLWTSAAYPHPGFNYGSHILFPSATNPSPNDTLDDIDYAIGHGTHCAGISTGDGSYGNGTHDTVGVAPSAKILVCNALVYFNGDNAGETLLEQSVLLGFQFCIAPPRDPTNGADVITTSLGVPDSYHPRYANYRAMERNIMEAGIPHAVAAGNEGPTPQTIRCMGDVPPPWPNPANNPTDTATAAVITVGATDNSDNAASFTSIGPSVIWGNTPPYNDYVYPPGLMDPDVCAPGVNIFSTFWQGDQAYTTMSGTSMATPGTAGCMALMLSKNPTMTPRVVDSILEMTSHDLGPTGKDVTYGQGRINCSLAVAMTPLPSGLRTLRYTIDDAAGGNGDGIINPGEAINLPTWILNLNGHPNLGVRSYLRKDTADPNVTLTDTFRYFGTVTDSAYTGASGYKFSVASGLPDGYQLRLSLVLKDTLDSMWVNPLGLHVGAAVLAATGDIEVQDPPPGGNNNGKLDPGDAADIELGVRDIGGGNAAGVEGHLISLDSRFQVIDSVGVYGSIRHDTTVFNTADPFHVHCDNTIPREFQIPCSLRLIAAGYTVTRYLTIPCGVLTSTDPIPDGPRTPPRYYAYDDGDVNYTQHPTYNWIELRGIGTTLPLADDQTIAITIPPEFGPFLYYGQSYTQLSICSNGFIMPGSQTATSYTNESLPSTSITAPMMCGVWDDWYPPTGDSVKWMYDPGSHALVVEWDSCSYYPSASAFDKWEFVIYDSSVHSLSGDNVFTYQYNTANHYSSCTMGEQDPTHAIWIQGLFNNVYHRACLPLAPGRAIKFTTDTITTGIAEQPSQAAGLKLALSAGMNPFRGTGLIHFSLPAAAAVRLVVYDINGRVVRTLVNNSEPMKAGVYNVRWNGKDDAGRSTAHGVYFYRLRTSLGTLACKTVKVD